MSKIEKGIYSYIIVEEFCDGDGSIGGRFVPCGVDCADDRWREGFPGEASRERASGEKQRHEKGALHVCQGEEALVKANEILSCPFCGNHSNIRAKVFKPCQDLRPL